MKMNLFVKLAIQKILYVMAEVIRILFFWAPIKKNKIFFMSYAGTKYACNQRYLTEYIIKNNEDYEMVWVYINEKTKNAIDDQCIKVKKLSFAYFYHLYSSHFICTNKRIGCRDLISKRKSQVYIQTWHSSMRLKKIEKDAGNQLPQVYINDAKRDSKFIDLMISGCDFSTSIFTNSFWYEGEILKIGTIRNDSLFKKDFTLPKVFEGYEDVYKVLYAPTFRNVEDYDYGLDYDRICEAVKKISGGKEVKVFLKQHPNVKKNRSLEGKTCIDITHSQDAHELLPHVDMLITDYSSILFDFMLFKKPYFLFAPDVNTYDRDLYFDFNEFPCGLSETSDDLVDKIAQLDVQQYKEDCERFLTVRLGSYEKGTAAKDLIDYLKKNYQ